MLSRPRQESNGRSEMTIVDDHKRKLESLQGQLTKVKEAVIRINENLDLGSVLQEVVESVQELTQARYGVIAIQTETPRDFRVNWCPVGKVFPTWVDSSGNAFPKSTSYTISGLEAGGRFKVRVRARYSGYSGDWSNVVEDDVASVEAGSSAAKMAVSPSSPTDSPLFKAVGAVNLVSSQPGELTVSWDAPDDSEQPHDLITAGMSDAENQRLEEAESRLPFFAYLSRLFKPLRVPDIQSHMEAMGLADFHPFPMSSFLAAPIRHHGIVIGSFCLANEKGGQEFSQEDEEILEVFASLSAAAIVNSRRYEKEQQATEKLSTVIDTSPVGVGVFNSLSGDPRSINREAKRILQMLDPSNRPLRKLLDALTIRSPDGQEMLLKEFVVALCQSDCATLRTEEFVLFVPNGRSKTVLVNASTMGKQSGEAMSLVVTIQDMTPLEELEKQRAEFLGMVSHELRMPLTSIKGSVVTLRESLNSLDPAEIVQFIRVIEIQANRMRDLISHLLDVARIETGSLSVTPEPADVVVLIDEARSSFLSGGGRDLVSVDLETNLPLVMADKRRVVQVLDNLLSNAEKYSHVTSGIRVSVALDGGHIAFSVADKGIGVPPERIPLLFRKFTRISNEKEQREIAGSGLGLAICKGIVEAHGGRIWAESGGLGMGTQFTFTLPVVDAEISDSATGVSLYSRETMQSGREPLRILAVDDDPRSLRYVRKVLSRAGYVPIVTGNPEKVLNLVKSDRPHLVLLDLMLPGSDGIELMKRILAITEVPVLFLSAYGRDETIAIALESGAADYIVKPFSQTELVARVRAALRRQLVPVQKEPAGSFVLGDLIVDYAERKVTVAGRPISLTVTEYNLLYELTTHAGRVLTYTELLRKVWNMDHSSDRSVIRTNIGRLRRKLGDDADNPTYVFAEPGVGYRMPKGVDFGTETEKTQL